MNVLLIDIDGVFLDFALRCQQWNHSVRLFIRNDPTDGRSKIGTGLVERVPHWEPHLNWADLIVCGGNDFYLTALENLRKHYPIFAPPLEGMRLELDREYGAKVLEEAGVDIIPYQCFRTYKEAEARVRKHPARYVAKPTNNRSGNAKKAMTYVSRNAADMCHTLSDWDKTEATRGPVMLQEFREGVELGVSGWFACGTWGKIEEFFEYKRLMNDDLGENTGEMGTVIKYVEKSKLFNALLKPLTGYLGAIDYRGDIAVSAMIGDDGTPWPTEFTSRLGWPDFYIRQALHESDPAQWMLDLMNGDDTLEVSPEVAVGVVIMLPKRKDGIPLQGITEELWPYIHLSEAMAGRGPCMKNGKVTDADCLVSCGDYLMVVSGKADTITKAKRMTYRNVDQLELPHDVRYRTDIGDMKDQIEQLQDLGYATEWE